MTDKHLLCVGAYSHVSTFYVFKPSKFFVPSTYVLFDFSWFLREEFFDQNNTISFNDHITSNEAMNQLINLI